VSVDQTGDPRTWVLEVIMDKHGGLSARDLNGQRHQSLVEKWLSSDWVQVNRTMYTANW
jgi:hypothetical protein